MTFFFVLLLLAAFVYFSRFHVNNPWGWAISLTIWLTIIKAPWFIFLALWWVCWNANDEQWRYDYLINPLKNAVDRFLAS